MVMIPPSAYLLDHLLYIANQDHQDEWVHEEYVDYLRSVLPPSEYEIFAEWYDLPL